MQGGQAFDIFAIDVYYHNSCYIKFAIKPPFTAQEEEVDELKLREMDVMGDFFCAVRIKILRKKEAFLLHQLLNDVKVISEGNGVNAVVTNTATLRRKLAEEFGEDIGFFPTGRYVIVHSSLMNPCEYSITTLEGHCLNDGDFVRSFANFVKEKMKKANINALPDDPESLLDRFKDGPLPDLYNAIYATMYSRFSVNEHGYAKTDSSNIATKIWSLALDWQSLITRTANAKQAMLGLTVHRLTGSKEAAQTLHSLGHTISYNEILRYNDLWAKNQHPVHKKFFNVRSLHTSIDNNDGRQETITGAGTTHDTNRTLFQPVLPGMYKIL